MAEWAGTAIAAGVAPAQASATNEVIAEAAIELRNAVPIEPPTCWPVLTIAEATPESPWSTPAVALDIDGAHAQAEDHQARAGSVGSGRAASARASQIRSSTTTGISRSVLRWYSS